VYLWNTTTDPWDHKFFSFLAPIALAAAVHYILEKPLMTVTDVVCTWLKKQEVGSGLPLTNASTYMPVKVSKKSKAEDPEFIGSELITPPADVLGMRRALP
jgi:hypothetical protein